ncbi:MAG: Unknown protein [uncultured Sulfurovum sp.]|uniref:DUF4282 domain-containing protein n=1 Tax=uncultured Sulfurovum sp. TaxID=269237 RepID=A0A6S6TQB7_9BACT|nr:MAG: Unknown protein [uncultured Sulfurovum sp.]
MQDFLNFKTFISPMALIVFYYLGAIVMPLFIWFFSRWIMKKISMMEQSYQVAKNMAWGTLSFKQKILFMVLFIIMFLFMQLLWRMMFEFLIAYMQIREALYT